jgi:hypothetical protein
VQLVQELLLRAQMAADGADKAIDRGFDFAKADKLFSEVCKAFTSPPRSPSMCPKYSASDVRVRDASRRGRS